MPVRHWMDLHHRPLAHETSAQLLSYSALRRRWRFWYIKLAQRPFQIFMRGVKK